MRSILSPEVRHHLFVLWPALALLALLGVSSATGLRAASLPPDVLAQLNTYNEVWTTPTANGSPGSMPLGNGDLTANVWVENGGDLMMYIGKSDTWSEGTRLLKLGRVRIHFSPNPFTVGAPFNRRSIFISAKLTLPPGKLARR